MKREKPNMENFLKSKLDRLETHYQDDWSVLEQKLERAVYMKQLRRAMLVGAVSILFLGFFIGVNSNYFYNGHIPHEQFGPPLPVEIQEDRVNESLNPANHPSVQAEHPLNSTEAIPPVNKKSVVDHQNSMTYKNPGNNIGSELTSNPGAINSSADKGIAARNTTASIRASNDALTEEFFEAQSFIDLPFAPAVFRTSKNNIHYNSSLLSENKRSQVGISGFGDIENFGSKFDLRIPTVIGKNFIQRNTPYVSPLQEDNPWGYSINFYPNFSFRKFKVDRDKQNYIHNDFVDATQASENGGFSLNIGFEVSRRIGAITFINGGIEYISDKTEVAYDFINFRNANMSDDGQIRSYTYKDEAERISFTDKNIYHYLNFPLSISYQPWASDHVRLNIEAGASYLLFLGANGKTLNYKTLEIIDLSERNFRNSMASVSIKIGANYYVSQRLNIGFEPTLRYFSNTIYTEQYPFYVIPYSVGLNFNIQIKLN